MCWNILVVRADQDAIMWTNQKLPTLDAAQTYEEIVAAHKLNVPD